MAIILPSAFSTFGDATRTEGPLRKYVLAQFRSDADLAWVGELRAFLSTSELKYQLVKDARPRLKDRKNVLLWQRIEKGVGQATIIVVDPDPAYAAAQQAMDAAGAVAGVDYDSGYLHDACAAAVVAGTPIAHLPGELARVEGTMELARLDGFTPADIRKDIGPKLRDAAVFAARAHALFDVATRDRSLASTRDVFRSPLAAVILTELLTVQRAFDVEHPASVAVLNRASLAIADAIEKRLKAHQQISGDPLVKEVDSTTADHVQAADVAAGWARETIDTAGIRALGDRFERVWLNGTLLARIVG